MKKLCLLFLIFPLSLTGQNWLDDDARWIFSGGGYGGDHYLKYYTQGDSIFEGKSCKKIYYDRVLIGILDPVPGAVLDTHSKGSNIYHGLLYEENDSVFYKQAYSDFELAFDFTLQVGDSVGIYTECESDTTFLLLVKIDTVVIGDDSLRQQEFQVYGSWEELEGYTFNVLEKVGILEGVWAFAPFGYGIWGCIVGNPNYSFNCYYNANFEYTTGQNCQLQFETITNSQTLIYPNLKIYPNPTNNFLFLDNLPNNLTSIKVFDAAGKLQIETLNSPIETQTWVEGVYYIQISSPATIEIIKVLVMK